MATVTIKDIAEAIGKSISAAHRRADKEMWRCEGTQGQGSAKVYFVTDLPADVQTALVLAGLWRPPVADQSPLPEAAVPVLPYDRDSLHAAAERVTQKQRDTAMRRVDAVNQVLALIQLGTKVNDAFGQVGASMGYSLQAVREWYYQVKAYPRSDWHALLVAHHPGRQKVDIPVAAWDVFLADYLRPARPSARSCYDRLQRMAVTEGWKLPGYKTFVRRLESSVPAAAVVLAREGEAAAARLYPPQQRDRLHLAVLQAVNADGHKFDVFVEWEDGEVGRPVLVGVQDLASGKILAHRLGKTETAQLICLTFGDMVERYGIPDDAYLDNGRGFASKWLTGGTPTRYRFKVKAQEPAGILTQLGTRVHWVTPYSGQSKPIERAWRDLADYISRHPACEGAYTGPNPMQKPENYGSRAVPIAEFRALVDTEIAAHNARLGRRTAVCSGVKSFDQVFEEMYPRALIRKATVEQRRLWLLVAENVRADRQTGSITLLENRYWSEALVAHRGQLLIARFHPERLHEPLHVYTLDGRYIGTAECCERAGFNDAAAAQALARERNGFLRSTKEALAAERRIDALELAKRQPGVVPAEPPAEPAVVRATFRRAAGDGVTTTSDGTLYDPNTGEVLDTDTAFGRGVARLAAAKKAARKDRL